MKTKEIILYLKAIIYAILSVFLIIILLELTKGGIVKEHKLKKASDYVAYTRFQREVLKKADKLIDICKQKKELTK